MKIFFKNIVFLVILLIFSSSTTFAHPSDYYWKLLEEKESEIEFKILVEKEKAIGKLFLDFLSKDEIEAVDAYKSYFYRGKHINLNKYFFKNEIQNGAEAKVFKDFVSGFNKLPPIEEEMILFRGTVMLKEVAESFSKDTRVAPSIFFSTSRSKGFAIEYTDEEEDYPPEEIRTIFIIKKSQSSRRIAGINFKEDKEGAEFVFKPSTRFKVVDARTSLVDSELNDETFLRREIILEETEEATNVVDIFTGKPFDFDSIKEKIGEGSCGI